jgi:hypothetical protein
MYHHSVSSFACVIQVAVPNQCADVDACANGGEFDSDCKCRCNPRAQWVGERCSLCNARCANGGVVKNDTCDFACPIGYYGLQCETYTLVRCSSQLASSLLVATCFTPLSDWTAVGGRWQASSLLSMLPGLSLPRNLNRHKLVHISFGTGILLHACCHPLQALPAA